MTTYELPIEIKKEDGVFLAKGKNTKSIKLNFPLVVSVVPHHHEIKSGTIKSIIKQTGVTIEYFLSK